MVVTHGIGKAQQKEFAGVVADAYQFLLEWAGMGGVYSDFSRPQRSIRRLTLRRVPQCETTDWRSQSAMPMPTARLNAEIGGQTGKEDQ